MCVYVFPVFMRDDQHLKPLPCLGMLRKLHSVPVSLLRCDLFVRMIALDKMFVRPSAGLTPQFLCCLHFVLDRFRLTVQTAYQLFFGLFSFCHIIQYLAYACF